jgi:O-antigen/teichoic acid export membrane protein
VDQRPADDALPIDKLAEAGASGVRWVSLARVAIELTALGSMVVLARLVPPAEFGKYAVVVIFLELSLAVPTEGIGSAIVQRRSLTREHDEAGVLLSLLVSAALCVLTLLLTITVIPDLFGESTAALVQMATPVFLLSGVATVPWAILKRRLAFRRLGLVQLAATLVRTVAAITLALAGLDGAALVLGEVAGWVVTATLLVMSAGLAFPRWRPRAIRDITGFGLPAATAGVFWTAFRSGDYAVIGARLGTLESGLYWRAYQVAVEYPRKVTNIMAQVAFPLLSRTDSSADFLEIRRRMTRLVALVLVPPLAALALFAPIAIPWIFGPAWTAAVVPAQILVVGGLATVLLDAMGPVIMAAGRPRAILKFGVAHSVVYLGAVVFVTPFGITAVSIAAGVVHGAFVFVAYAWLLGMLVDNPMRCLWDDTAAALVSCCPFVAVAAAGAWGVEQSGAPAPLAMLAASGLGTGAYLLTVRVCFAEAFRDLQALIRRLAPGLRLPRVGGRLSPAGARPSA